MPAGARVLELGCGGGNPATRILAERYEYLGVDLSPVQIERSRAAMPGVRFEVGDATSLEQEAATVDGIVSLFMLGHVPRVEQASLLQRIEAWLRPGGWLLATMGTAAAEDEVDPDWLGAPMFFASFDEPTNHCLLRAARLDAVEARVVPFEEPGHGLVRFMWVLAQKSHSRHEAHTYR